ncbi:MAG TPA: thioredoxin-disulfide reductase [Candidatus Nanoarchaeia archaeon]|nr:thioredoxin-disulfide reductase [Candidatus Nanoarchaeia archaeon]
MENVIILGAGIAGYTAAIYTARANLKPVLVGGPEVGGQLTLTTEVENYPGFPSGVQGPELMQMMRKQAEKFGTRFIEGVAKRFDVIKEGYEVQIGEQVLQAKSVIIATGASARWLDIPSEQKYKGRGVSTCATCDGFFYRGKEVAVIGGGDSACEEGMFLTKFANKVSIVHRRDELRASKIMQDRAKKNPKIAFIWGNVVEEVLGDGQRVTGVKLKNVKTGMITEMKTDGVFLAIGHVPNTKSFEGKLDLDEKGYLKTDRCMHTNLLGVFGAGDVQDFKYKQAVTAAGSGCQAAMEAEKYLEGLEH